MDAKTYKRETGWVLVGVCVIIAIVIMFSETVDLMKARAGVLAIIATPSFMLLFGGLGMDWMRKQTTWGGKPEDVLPPASHPSPADPEFVG